MVLFYTILEMIGEIIGPNLRKYSKMGFLYEDVDSKILIVIFSGNVLFSTRAHYALDQLCLTSLINNVAALDRDIIGHGLRDLESRLLFQ